MAVFRSRSDRTTAMRNGWGFKINIFQHIKYALKRLHMHKTCALCIVHCAYGHQQAGIMKYDLKLPSEINTNQTKHSKTN